MESSMPSRIADYKQDLIADLQASSRALGTGISHSFDCCFIQSLQSRIFIMVNGENLRKKRCVLLDCYKIAIRSLLQSRGSWAENWELTEDMTCSRHTSRLSLELEPSLCSAARVGNVFSDWVASGNSPQMS